MYRLHTICRACGYGAPPPRNKRAGLADHLDEVSGEFVPAQPPDKLIPVLDLGVQPLANDFRKADEEHAGYAPLKVLFCPRCSLAQLSVVVRPDILYSNYSFVTFPSKTMLSHFAALIADIKTEQQPGSAVEIGSNNGIFLAALSDAGYGNVTGIDPAKNLVPEANKKGIFTINEFFNAESANMARVVAGNVDLVVARHCFCHMDDWHGFMKSLDSMTHAETLTCIEVPYVVDQLASGSFDQIYHEHLSYLSVKAMKALLDGTNYHLHRICHYAIHGGCVLLMIRRNDSLVPPHPSVDGYLAEENVTVETWKAFRYQTEKQIEALRTVIKGYVEYGKRVCGYGASAKSSVWINACGFTKREIACICDSTAQKVYCNSPGSEIPIVHEGGHFTGCFDYVILFAWNYADEIIERERQCGHHGFSFIVPVPELRVITLDETTRTE